MRTDAEKEPKCEGFIKSLLSQFRESQGRGGRKIVRPREGRGNQEKKDLWFNKARHMRFQQAQVLYGFVQIHCVDTIAFSLVFLCDSWLWEVVILSFLCLLLEHFSSCWVVMFNFDMIVFASFYCILFHMLVCCLLEACPFPMRDRKGMGPDGRYVGKTGRSRETGNYNQDVSYEKTIYFQ